MRKYIKKLSIAGMIAICSGMFLGEGKLLKASAIAPAEDREEWIWPADGVISDTFGTRMGKHKGIDIAGSLNSPILAVDAGVVEKSYYSDSYGNVIFIHHPASYVTVYAHLASRLVFEGQSVRKGQIIGRMGSSGQATGVHLHFEAHRKEWRFDKKFVLDPEGLLGVKKLGEVVQAGKVNREVNALEASTRFHPQEENNQHVQTASRFNHTYIVKRGDTLTSISLQNQLTIEELKRKNGLSSELIVPGQKLIVR